MWQVIVVAVSVVVGVFVGWRLHSGVAARRTERPTAASLSPAFATPSPPPAAEVIEALRLGVAMSGKDGAGEFRNAAARAMTLDHLALDDAIERHLARGLAGLRSEEVVELEGSPKAVYVVHSTALPNGGSVVFVDDVSERRRIDRVRTDFVANVSHELKTPIGAISVLAETLQDEDDLTTVGRLATRLLGEAERAANTIDDLMELSRIELGGDRVTHPVSVARIVGDAVERVRELVLAQLKHRRPVAVQGAHEIPRHLARDALRRHRRRVLVRRRRLPAAQPRRLVAGGRRRRLSNVRGHHPHPAASTSTPPAPVGHTRRCACGAPAPEPPARPACCRGRLCRGSHPRGSALQQQRCRDQHHGTHRAAGLPACRLCHPVRLVPPSALQQGSAGLFRLRCTLSPDLDLEPLGPLRLVAEGSHVPPDGARARVY